MKRIIAFAVTFCLVFVQIPMVVFADYIENDIEVSPTSVTMYLCDGYEKKITAKGSGTVPEGTVVEWSIKDESIATVENGVFKPIKIGETVAYAKYGNVVAELNVTVLKPEIIVDSLYELVVGETKTLHLEKSTNICKVTFSSDNESVATVDENGVVTALSAGVANIIIQGCGAKPVETQIQVEDPGDAEIFVYTENFRVGVGQCLRFPHKVEPSVYKLSYTSSDESIATVDETGYINGITPGTVVITITAPGGVTKDVPVTITEGIAYTITIPNTEFFLYTGERKGIAYKIDTEDFDVRFTSSDESVVKVEYGNELVAVSEGTAVVTGVATGADPVEVYVTVVKRTISAPKISVTYSANGMKISWNKVEGAKWYEIYRKVDSGNWKLIETLGKSATSYSDKTIGYNKSYSYRVKAIGEWDDIVVESDYSSTVKKKTSTIYAPKTVKAERTGYKSVKVSWSRVYPATGYEIYRSTTGKVNSFKRVMTIDKATLSWKNTGLTTGQKYYYKVRAVYDKKKGNFSAAKSATPNLSKPVMKAAVNATGSTIKVSWKKVSYANGYTVYRKTTSGSWKNVGSVKGNKTFSFKDDPKAGVYLYSVKAYRTVNGKKVYSLRSDAIQTRTLKAPTVTVKAVDDEFKQKVTWTKITGATEYQIWRKDGSGSWKLATTKKSSATRAFTASVPHGKVINWKVRAIYKKGGTTTYSSYSKIKSFIISYEPYYSVKVPSASKSKMQYITISITNMGDYKMKILKEGAILNPEDESTARETVLVNSSTNKTMSSLTIDPGATKKVKMKVVDGTMKYNKYYMVGFTFRYDGQDFVGVSSAYYGSYCQNVEL